MRNSVFDLMCEEDLTNLKIQYDWHTGTSCLYAAKEWDEDIDWTQYNKTFTAYHILTPSAHYYGTDDTRALFRKHKIEAYLDQIIAIMASGRNLMEDFYYWKKEDVRFVSNIHSLRRGLNNRLDCVVMGALRRHPREEDEIEMLVDGMNLGRAMAFKNFAGGLPMGGAKCTVQQDELDVNNLANIGFLAYALDRTRDNAGPDMRMPTNMVHPMNQHFTLKFTGDPKGPLGESGTPTAYGSFIASKEAARMVFGSPSWAGKTVAIMGLGAVGFPLAKHYLEEGAKLTVSDISPKAIEKLLTLYPNHSIKVVPTDEIIYQDVDLLAPAAIGGLFSDDNLDKLRAKIIIGPGNNQIKASSPEEEIALARKLAAKGILFQVEWFHNVAGVMCAFEEYLHQEKASKEALYKKIDKICGENTRTNLEEAKRLGITPTERCYKVASEAIYDTKPAWHAV
ncbi:Glu/Leu/Phe/Val dehydrogenase family protein [Desulfovibrio sp. 86]|uniref:Phenylalanine dehydrogenase n=1 Tax=uncultured Desulfovibrio sp. TaxID=167968 RepID=A0A212L267_9BACT|nr:Glu/Leu/Phe/Val dehydrogenase family protein [Desulfovibrio sp. 86]SCM71651.1 Phenylalanine dehydrogenase [uncultured Desulfovibrio sp.]VZH33005.1 Phenylalanine dehydrogenase [Desulfovibrio sp. 86]